MEEYPLPPELKRELLLQINEHLAADGIIPRKVYELAKEKIVNTYHS